MGENRASRKRNRRGFFATHLAEPQSRCGWASMRVSTQDQLTIPMQTRALREYGTRRGWTTALQVKEISSGASQRERREQLLEAGAPPRGRRGVSLAAGSLGPVGHRSAGDLAGTGASGSRLCVANASAGFDHAGRSGDGRPAGDFRRVRKGNSPGTGARRLGACPPHRQRLGRPVTAGLHAERIRKLHRDHVSMDAIARQLSIGRTSVRRILARQDGPKSG